MNMCHNVLEYSEHHYSFTLKLETTKYLLTLERVNNLHNEVVNIYENEQITKWKNLTNVILSNKKPCTKEYSILYEYNPTCIKFQ